MSPPKSHSPPVMADEPAQPRASRLLDSVKRTVNPVSQRHARSSSQTMHMYSTPEEHAPSSPSATFRDPPPSASARPTIEQIAMGLHVSRTPHLRPASRFSSHSHPITPPISRRSSTSFKHSKHSTSSTAVSESSSALPSIPTCASASTSTIASASASLQLIPLSTNKPVSPSSSNTILAIKHQMARILPGEKRRSVSAPQLVIPADAVQKSIPPQKAVRFELLSNQACA